jgi:hypothetical protein
MNTVRLISINPPSRSGPPRRICPKNRREPEVFPITCGTPQHSYNSWRFEAESRDWRFQFHSITGFGGARERESWLHSLFSTNYRWPGVCRG